MWIHWLPIQDSALGAESLTLSGILHRNWSNRTKLSEWKEYVVRVSYEFAEVVILADIFIQIKVT